MALWIYFEVFLHAKLFIIVYNLSMDMQDKHFVFVETMLVYSAHMPPYFKRKLFAYCMYDLG
jgi:hypothetical protein